MIPVPALLAISIYVDPLPADSVVDESVKPPIVPLVLVIDPLNEPVAPDKVPVNEPLAAERLPENVPVAPDSDPVNVPLAAERDPEKVPVAADSAPLKVPPPLIVNVLPFHWRLPLVPPK